MFERNQNLNIIIDIFTENLENEDIKPALLNCDNANSLDDQGIILADFSPQIFTSMHITPIPRIDQNKEA
jgi:hypothetical protein